jgi:hypothetical protein
MEAYMSEEKPTFRLEHPSVPFVQYPRLLRLHKLITECLEDSWETGEPRCIALEGATGVGKSLFAEAIAASVPRLETKDGTIVSNFYVLTPSAITVGGMASAALEALGDPAAHKGTVQKKTSRLANLILDCETEMVTFDDFHNLINHDTDRVVGSASNWLKYLIKWTKKPFLVIGIEGRVRRILDSNPELSRLFAVRETLRPFAWDSADDIEEFSIFVFCAEDIIGMKISPELDRLNMLYKMHYGTRGVAANVMNLLRSASRKALARGSHSIEAEDLAGAFDRVLREHVQRPINPFVAIDELLPEEKPIEIAGDGKQSADSSANGTGEKAETEKKKSSGKRKGKKKQDTEAVSSAPDETEHAGEQTPDEQTSGVSDEQPDAGTAQADNEQPADNSTDSNSEIPDTEQSNDEQQPNNEKQETNPSDEEELTGEQPSEENPAQADSEQPADHPTDSNSEIPDTEQSNDEQQPNNEKQETNPSGEEEHAGEQPSEEKPAQADSEQPADHPTDSNSGSELPDTEQSNGEQQPNNEEQETNPSGEAEHVGEQPPEEKTDGVSDEQQDSEQHPSA